MLKRFSLTSFDVRSTRKRLSRAMYTSTRVIHPITDTICKMLFFPYGEPQLEFRHHTLAKCECFCPMRGQDAEPNRRLANLHSSYTMHAQHVENRSIPHYFRDDLGKFALGKNRSCFIFERNDSFP